MTARVLFGDAIVIAFAAGLMSLPRDSAVTRVWMQTGGDAASITGRVLADGTDPVGRARVTLNEATGRVGRTTATDDRGRFVFTNLPGGRYLLESVKPGYLTARFGAKRLEGLGTPIALGDGEALTDIVLTMPRGAAIAGTIFGEGGQPEPAAEIAVLRDGIDSPTGLKRLVPIGPDRHLSGPNGDYRIFGLPPGDYVLVATAHSTTVLWPTVPDVRRPSSSRDGAAEGVAFAPVFYPGTTDLNAAERITLTAGLERTGVSFPVLPVKTALVSGSVTAPTGVRLESVSLQLLPYERPNAADLGLGLAVINSARASTIGAFEFRGVAPDRYRVLAKAGAISPPGNVSARDDFLAAYWGEAIIDVAGPAIRTDVEMKPAAVLHGRVAGGPAILGRARTLSLRLQDLDRGQLTVHPETGGAFVVEGLAPGRYRLALDQAQPSPALVLRSITIGARDVTDMSFNLAAGQAIDLVVTLTDRAASLSGRLLNDGPTPATDYYVVVFPAANLEDAIGSSRIAVARPDSSGQYLLAALRPGDYRLAVTSDLIPSDLLNVSYLEQLLPASLAVSVGEGEQKRCDLRVAGLPIR